jgi:hypothetical protein
VPYSRVVSIRTQLENLASLREKMKDFGPDPVALDAAVRKHQRNRARLEAAIKRGEKPIGYFATTFPGDRVHTAQEQARFAELTEQIKKTGRSVNEALRKYKFHPQVAYVRRPGDVSVLQNVWAGEMVPTRRWFEVRINGSVISEPYAVLALVRLDLTGELHKVRLCEMCRLRWRVVAKSHYRFCSDKCREEFYANQPDYHQRKRRNQQRYRETLKKLGRKGE